MGTAITKGGWEGRREIKNEASVLNSLYRIDVKRQEFHTDLVPDKATS